MKYSKNDIVEMNNENIDKILPIYINEFNALSKYYMTLNNSEGKYMKLYNKKVGKVNNKWCSLPYIETVGIDDLRVAQQKRDGFGDYAYRLKWIL